MPIESTCPNCNKRLKAAAGAKVACPGCKTVFRMPMPADPPAPAEFKEAVLELDRPSMPPEPIVEDKLPAALPNEPDEIYEAVLEGEPPPKPGKAERFDDEPAEPKKKRKRLYDDEIECPECGAINHEDEVRCRKCDFPLRRGRRRRRSEDSDGGLDNLIPYKNAWALWSYYLGVFSLVPCFGLPLAIAALITGIKGLSYASQHANAKGRVHAWVGIILGSLVMLVYVILCGLAVWAGAKGK